LAYDEETWYVFDEGISAATAHDLVELCCDFLHVGGNEMHQYCGDKPLSRLPLP
jgi:hypothetical protein